MAGHSKWANIKHRKAAQDAKRGKIFTKLIREIMVAARLGGGSPEANPRLRAAIAAARAENMPKDTIERAIKKGTGEIEGETYEEITCEGYAAGGVAVLVEAMTDNRNRTISELRNIFSRNGGNLGEAGCVAWMFEKKGLIIFPKDKYSEDEIMEVALEAGADDVKDQGDQIEVITSVADFSAVKQAFDDRSMEYSLARITMIPQTTIRIEDLKQAQQVIKLMETLEDHDDVQNAYANFDIPDELLKSLV